MRWAAVLGRPVGHSLSPVLHRAAYAALGLDRTYEAVDCDSAGLAGRLAAARRDPTWAGYSLTMPLKITAVPLVDSLDTTAAALGAVNTVSPRDGGLHGANTDVDGVVAALAEAGFGSAPRRPVVLGAGGTARAAVAALARLGSAAVTVHARRPEAVAPLVDLGAALGIAVTGAGWDLPAGADLVLATTPAHATDALATRGWPGGALVELLYDPWPTDLVVAARAAGVPVVGGLSVLVGQAVGQVRIFTGQEVDPAVLRAAGDRALDARTP